jgi:hypothetical protein
MGLRYHDRYTKFHKDWFRNSELIWDEDTHTQAAVLIFMLQMFYHRG